MIVALTPIILAILGGVGWFVKFLATRVVEAIDSLKEENTKQHTENADKLDKFASNLDSVKETVGDTNTRVAVIEVDLDHVKQNVQRNSDYIDSRRPFTLPHALPPEGNS